LKNVFPPGLKSGGRAATEEDGKSAMVGSVGIGCFTVFST
jgi:hypothetical protein